MNTVERLVVAGEFYEASNDCRKEATRTFNAIRWIAKIAAQDDTKESHEHALLAVQALGLWGEMSLDYGDIPIREALTLVKRPDERRQ